MGQVRFTPVAGTGKTRTYKAKYDVLGPDLPKKPVQRGPKQMRLTMGDPDFKPQGTEVVNHVHEVKRGES